MAKRLEDLEREFQERKQTALPDGEIPKANRASARLEELDRQFQASVLQKRELEEQAKPRPRPHFTWPRKGGQARDKPDDGSEAAVDATYVGLPPLSDEEKRKLRRKHIFSRISDVLFYAAMILLVVAAYFYCNGQGDMGGGIHTFGIQTSSMQSVYPKGCMVIVKEVDPEILVVGNDICYYIDANTTVTHRVISIAEDYQGSGERAFTTKGVNNTSADMALVRESSIVGKVIFSIPMLGALLLTVQQRLWIILALFISILAFSFFISLTLGDTWQERKERKARRVLEEARLRREEEELLERQRHSPPEKV